MIFEKELTLKQAISSINDASSIRELDVIRQSYLGKKGIITTSFKEMSTLPAEEKKKMGVELNSVKTSILSAISERKSQLSLDETVDFDVTLPIPVDMDEGSLSPITTVSKEVCEILKSMGFRIISGPEIELEENNFDLLNIPATHPAREIITLIYTMDRRLDKQSSKAYVWL